MAEENKDIKQIVEDAIVSKLHSQFMFGCLTGWMTACQSVKGKTKDLTSAKAMKAVIAEMCKEADDRLQKYEAKNNPANAKEETNG